MAEDAAMQIYQLKTELIEAKVMCFDKVRELDEKNKEIEEFRRILEQQKNEIDSLKKCSQIIANAEPSKESIQLKQKNIELEEKNKEVEDCKMLLLKLNAKIVNYQEETAELKRKNKELEQRIEIIKEENIQSNRKNNDIARSRAHELDDKNREIEEFRKILEQQKNEINSLKKSSKTEEITKLDYEFDVIAKPPKDVDDNENSVLILGGYSETSSRIIYLLDSFSQSWKKLKIILPNPMHSFGTAVINEEIYIFGYEKCCYKLKSDGSWMQMASLNEGRAEISNSSVVYFEEIWVIGGCSDDEIIKSVEKYNISQNKWIQMPKLNESRRNAAAAVFKDKIIVAGGFFNKKYLKSAEIFDADLQRWTIFCDLPYPLAGHCMIITDSILTIYGGCSVSNNCWSPVSLLKNIWEMDINDPEKKWTEKKELKYARCSFGIAKFSNATVVFGNSLNSLDSTEIFDGNNWTEGPKLPVALSKFAYTEIPRIVEERLLKKFS